MLKATTPRQMIQTRSAYASSKVFFMNSPEVNLPYQQRAQYQVRFIFRQVHFAARISPRMKVQNNSAGYAT
jgi:hypothetical protein